LRKTNEATYSHAPGTMTVAEESTSWPGVSHPTYTVPVHHLVVGQRQDEVFREGVEQPEGQVVVVVAAVHRIDFLRKTNEATYSHAPGTMTVAEESTSWPGVSHPWDSGRMKFSEKA
jgi:1,4-alpha-glucan branching enzyme